MCRNGSKGPILDVYDDDDDDECVITPSLTGNYNLYSTK